jgi:hypothetical protein
MLLAYVDLLMVGGSVFCAEMASGIGAEAGVKSCCLGDLALLGEY